LYRAKLYSTDADVVTYATTPSECQRLIKVRKQVKLTATP